MMTPLRPLAPLAALTLTLCLLVSGCAGLSTQEVESELEKLRFHSNMHVVQAGDTLETVAFRYRLQPAELAALNPELGGTGLRAGMRINVRPGTELSAAVRQGARVAAGPGSPAPAPRVTVATPSSTSGPAPQPAAPSTPTIQAAPPMTVPSAPSAPGPTTVIATAPARPSDPSQARVPAAEAAPSGSRPAAAPDMVIREARWQSPTGSYPREEVIPDDLGPMPEAFASVDPVAPAPVYTPVEVPAPIRAPEKASGAAPAAARGDARAGAGWVWPTAGQIARGFAPDRVDGQGVDIAGAPGQDVRAAAGGTVIYSGKSLTGDGGNLIILRHDDGLMTTYAHADRLFVTEDDVVRAGDAIASLGWNEASESVLSFEVRRAGEASPLDPLRFVAPE